MSFKVLVLLANGFEEIETTTIIDVLRRAQISVTSAGIIEGPMTGSRKIILTPDTSLDKINPTDFQLLVLPGGQPGTNNLMADERVIKLIQTFHKNNKHLAAICAAPMVLAKAGVLEFIPATCYPGCETGMGKADLKTDKVVASGNILTSQGPGTAFCFALRIVEIIKGNGVAEEVRKGLLLPESFCKE